MTAFQIINKTKNRIHDNLYKQTLIKTIFTEFVSFCL